LSQAISQIDMTAWPAPVIRLFLGQMTPTAVLAAAADPDAGKKKGQVCEANFYSGELARRVRTTMRPACSASRRTIARTASSNGNAPTRSSRCSARHLELC
jgi:hypothetical protein